MIEEHVLPTALQPNVCKQRNQGTCIRFAIALALNPWLVHNVHVLQTQAQNTSIRAQASHAIVTIVAMLLRMLWSHPFLLFCDLATLCFLYMVVALPCFF